MKYKAKILSINPITHDVKRITLEKPKGYKFSPGQATEFAINKANWKDNKHPFTFTSLNEDDRLELIIKGYSISKYPDHSGMTEKLHKLSAGDELLFDDPWGTIEFKGPGVFVAGGAGITPFIAIFRDLKKNNNLKGSKLIFSNKTKEDIILEKELRETFGNDNLILTLTQSKDKGYESGRVDKKFMEQHIEDFSQNFYVCGPGLMVADIKKSLSELGAESGSIVFEE